MKKKEINIDKRTLEIILSDQKYEVESWSMDKLCARNEERLIDLVSPQAQVVIGVRRSGKSTLCMQTLAGAEVKFAYVDFDDERLSGLKTEQHNVTKCTNLLLLTDHEAMDIQKEDLTISVRPVLEWACIPYMSSHKMITKSST